MASGRADLSQHEPAWRRLRSIPNIGNWTLEMLAVAGQGDDQLPALDVAYTSSVGLAAGLGRRATEEGARVLRSLRRVRGVGRLLRASTAALRSGSPRWVWVSDSETKLTHPLGQGVVGASGAAYSSGMTSLRKTDAEWREELSPDRFHILREEGTEPPFTGAYTHSGDGMYRCGACGNGCSARTPSSTPVRSWPSFTEPAVADAVELHEDRSLGMVRTEVTCARCGDHLGHVFPDGPGPGGQRYCINSLSLDLDENGS